MYRLDSKAAATSVITKEAELWWLDIVWLLLKMLQKITLQCKDVNTATSYKQITFNWNINHLIFELG